MHQRLPVGSSRAERLDESYNNYWVILSAQFLVADVSIFILFCTFYNALITFNLVESI